MKTLNEIIIEAQEANIKLLEDAINRHSKKRAIRELNCARIEVYV